VAHDILGAQEREGTIGEVRGRGTLFLDCRYIFFPLP